MTAQRVDRWLYARSAEPVLVTCEWYRALSGDGTIPSSLAVPMFLESELRCRQAAEFGETWETMRPYFLGAPHGARSSLFITQDTGTAMRTIWRQLLSAGTFGPIKV